MASSSISESLSTLVCQNMDTEDTAESSHYDRWLVVHSVDSDHSISKLSPFILDKAIRSAVGTMKTVRLLRNGHLLLEVASAVQSRIVNKLDNLAGCPVTASPHRTLNTSKGVIRCAQLVDCDEDETLRELKPQGVSAIYNITVKDNSGGSGNTSTFIITFKTPKYLHIGYLRLPVSTYIPNPLRCFNCQKFGHGKNACRGRDLCQVWSGWPHQQSLHE